MNISWDYLKQLGERVIGAFLSAFLGAIVAGELGVNILSTNWSAAALAGAGAAVLTLLKGLLAKLGFHNTAPSLLRSKR